MESSPISPNQSTWVKNYKLETVPFIAGDGRELNLLHAESDTPASKGPVLLVHGAGVRANIFMAPVEQDIVDALLQHGYDVWLENWRASIEFPANLWSLDQAALYDHPKAVATIIEQTGHNEVKAIIHCQGSTSFTMSAVAGLIPQVTTIVTNAVSLHPIVPSISKLKLQLAIPPVSWLMDYLNPQWGLNAPDWKAKLIDAVVNLVHREQGNKVSKHVSFTYGTGHPTLWNYDNLNAATQDWLQHEFAAVPLGFFKQIIRCIRQGNLIAVEQNADLPKDFAAQPPRTDARFAFFAGEDNLCFLPDSQIKSFKYFDRLRPDYHSLNLVKGYGHLDMFMGEHASRDVFPLMIKELDRTH
jgi:hypothetical protein